MTNKRRLHAVHITVFVAHRDQLPTTIRDNVMNKPQYYEICVEGHIDGSWSPWFQGMTVRHKESGETILSGALVDQAALHGVLMKIRDLGLPLVEVKRVKGDDASPN